MIITKKLLFLPLLSAVLVGSSFIMQPQSGIPLQPVSINPIIENNESEETIVGYNADNSSNDTDKTSQTNYSISPTTSPSFTKLTNQIKNIESPYKPMRSPYVQEYMSDEIVYSDNGATYPSRTYKTQVLPNDPSAEQWWTTSSRLPELWDKSTGSTSTVLAIIDTGFALQHEEFAGRWLENTAEMGVATVEAPSKYNCSDRSLTLDKSCNLIDDNFDGIVDNESGVTTNENPSQLNCSAQVKVLDKSCNMIDDDNNGLVDDWRGWDFMNFDNSVQAGDINPNGNGTRHGSYVSGVAAANANNNVGIAGVNWQTKILPIQALSDDGSGTSISVARGIRYATARGADVINLSLGGSFPDSFTRQAIQEAVAAGVIVVAATGNDGCDCLSYPANYPEVVAVGAIDQQNQRASFSSYGENVDIVAPGTQLYTTSWSPINQTSGYASGINGTSLATPIVSGLITTLVGEYPELTLQEIISILTENTNRLSMVDTTPHDNQLGYGALDSITAFLRPLTTRSPEIRYGFALNNSTKLHACEDTYHGSSKLYRLTKSNDELYSSDPIRVYQLEQNGYAKQLLTHACRSMNIDTPQLVRSLNLSSEFSSFKKFY